MKIVWVVVLSLIALLLGSCGGLAWRGTSTVFSGLRIACAVTATAEKSGILTKAQVSDMIDRMAKVIDKNAMPDGADAFSKELKTGCPTYSKL